MDRPAPGGDKGLALLRLVVRAYVPLAGAALVWLLYRWSGR